MRQEVFDLDCDLDLEESICEAECDADETPEPKEWNIISALDRVLNGVHHSELSPETFQKLASPLSYLRERLQMSDMQIVFLAMLADAGKPLSWRSFGNYLHCSRLKVMTYTEEMDGLLSMRWVSRSIEREFGNKYQAYCLDNGVITALRHNKAFVPEKLDGLSEQEFFDKLSSHISAGMRSNDLIFEDDEIWLMNLVDANPDIKLCRFIRDMNQDIHCKSLLLMIICDYIEYGDSEDYGLNFSTINQLYPDELECNFMRHQLIDGIHPLFSMGLIDFKCEDGIVNDRQYVLTEKAIDQFLFNYTIHRAKSSGRNQRFLKSHTVIREKSLYFNSSEEKQLQRLTSLLQQDQLPAIQSRLQQSGMRKGFACLFYGAPGTGKTESVLQLARQTGRDIMQVDIAGMRDKWVGESEKNIKQVFVNYRSLCKECELTPILFFNEADALINKRTENIEHSVDKMDNAMQNILLQEMEDLDGILIATTNLTSNLDKAFERRFLFKIEFHKPETEVKAKIWSSMISDLSSEDATTLALRYDFSGGQIENIARKNTIDYILTGEHHDLSQLDEYCREELLASKNIRQIGFRS